MCNKIKQQMHICFGIWPFLTLAEEEFLAQAHPLPRCTDHYTKQRYKEHVFLYDDPDKDPKLQWTGLTIKFFML